MNASQKTRRDFFTDARGGVRPSIGWLQPLILAKGRGV